MSSYFEDLDVWKKGCDLSVRLYRLLSDSRDYGIKDQILRSAISIPSNIAEGSERKSKKEFKRFISYSLGSAAELRTQVFIAKQLDILPEKDSEESENFERSSHPAEFMRSTYCDMFNYGVFRDRDYLR